jgi:uncharacterized membrane protein YsdA (DUF1294 family)
MQKVLTSILLVASLLTGGVGAVTAAEQIRKSDEQSSFLERYTNAAQDVILQGLKLVASVIALAVTMKTAASIAAVLSAWSSRTALVLPCPAQLAK